MCENLSIIALVASIIALVGSIIALVGSIIALVAQNPRYLRAEKTAARNLKTGRHKKKLRDNCFILPVLPKILSDHQSFILNKMAFSCRLFFYIIRCDRLVLRTEIVECKVS